MRKVGNLVLWASGLAIALAPGCGRRSQAPAGPPARLVRSTPTWGPETEGLQCRLRPTKRIWTHGQTITFRLDIRNGGKRLFAFDAREPIHADRVGLDDRWHRRPRSRTTAAQARPLGPGVELPDLALALPARSGLPLDPGRYHLRVAFVLEGVEVVSNPVAIEIAAAP